MHGIPGLRRRRGALQRNTLYVLRASVRIFDGDLGVVRAVARPETANWPLALVIDLHVGSAPMLLHLDRTIVGVGRIASACTGVHGLFLAQKVAHGQSGAIFEIVSASQ